MTPEQDFEFTKGQYHYALGGRKEDLIHPYSRAGWEVEKFQRKKEGKGK
jgi:hypothetical protein